ncbi:ABC transporter ATP-binding protein [Amycolatopsis sp. EV170708-02-1]|uniref:ABC transporter ATP-binding protein n=1 Tax=Amycolatopsis sp. EV170708-02-1 TaxID=2919322 RepID=UPI001F0BC124|nr:ABC transporter ATP-binding protein [Amycolatopsis sp. EV170708-02-1]UMP06774.1 ABC transporter ATP-binding protein/permease [Amycolatopsis sp. EV170708-02-1]
MRPFTAVVRRSGGWLPLIGLPGLVGTLVALARPVVFGNAVDAIFAGSGSGRWFAIAAGLIAAGVLADLIGAYADDMCVASTTAWLRDRLVRHVFAIGLERSRRFDGGDLVSRVSGNAVDAAEAGPSVVTAGLSLLPPVGSLFLLAFIDPWLAVAFLAGVTLVGLVLWAFTKHTTEVVIAYSRALGRIAARLSESLSGARTIAAAGTVEREQCRVLEALPALHEQGRRSWLVLSRSVAQAAVVGPLVIAAVLTAGGFALLAGRISPGEMFAASQYAVMGAGLGGLTGVFGRLARARAGAGRAGEVLAVSPVEYGGLTLPDGPGKVEFRAVSAFAGDTTLVEDVDLVVPGGTSVAVVGRSGAGKSVLAELAARLRDPENGQVLLDGVPLAELSHEVLRKAVGCAFERPVLVGATVGDAIGVGADPDRIREAARATHADDFVTRLPDGYHTPLAEAPMSGGEAQRLGLARAWPAERLLVLDDATSSLDMVTEMQISRTLAEDHGRRTRLVVTHRVSMAARADLVVWLEDGRVRAVGSHEELWEQAAYQGVFG